MRRIFLRDRELAHSGWREALHVHFPHLSWAGVAAELPADRAGGGIVFAHCGGRFWQKEWATRCRKVGADLVWVSSGGLRDLTTGRKRDRVYSCAWKPEVIRENSIPEVQKLIQAINAGDETWWKWLQPGRHEAAMDETSATLRKLCHDWAYVWGPEWKDTSPPGNCVLEDLDWATVREECRAAAKDVQALAELLTQLPRRIPVSNTLILRVGTWAEGWATVLKKVANSKSMKRGRIIAHFEVVRTNHQSDRQLHRWIEQLGRGIL